jgi:hypothetical protein
VRTDGDVHHIGASLGYDQTVDLLVWRSGQTIGMRATL